MLRDEKLYKSFDSTSNFILKICLDTTRKRVQYTVKTHFQVLYTFIYDLNMSLCKRLFIFFVKTEKG